MHTNELCSKTDHFESVTLFMLGLIECGDVGEVSIVKKSVTAAGNYKGD